MKRVIVQMSVATVEVGLLCLALTAHAARWNQNANRTATGGGGTTGEIVFRGTVTQIAPASFIMVVHGADATVGETAGAAPKQAGGKKQNQAAPAAPAPATSGAPQDRQFSINLSCRITNGQSTATIADLKPGTAVDVTYAAGSVGSYTATGIAITTGGAPSTAPTTPAKGKKKNNN